MEVSDASFQSHLVKMPVIKTEADLDTIFHHSTSETICLQCGDRGFTNAFVYCVKCLKFAVHRYCLYEMPKSVNEFAQWVCDDCDGEVQNQPVAAFECKMEGNNGGQRSDFEDDVRNIYQECTIEKTMPRNPNHDSSLRSRFKSGQRGTTSKVSARGPGATTIVSSRYPEDVITGHMGIQSNVEQLFNDIGWTSIYQGTWTTYPALTTEFLQTVTVERVAGAQRAKFNILGQQYTLTAKQIDEILKTPTETVIPPDSPFRKDDRSISLPRFWMAIADDNFPGNPDMRNLGNAKASRICNPVLRYIQRVLGNSVFGRNEFGKINSEELLVLYCMVGGYKLSLSKMLMEHWDRVRKQQVGKIRCGGLITAIVDAVNKSAFDDLDKLRLEWVDEACLRNGHFLETRGITRYIKLEQVKFRLEDPALTYIRGFDNRANWKMDTAAHQRYYEPLTAARTTQARTRLCNPMQDDREAEEEEIHLAESGGCKAPDPDQVSSSRPQMQNAPTWFQEFAVYQMDRHDALQHTFDLECAAQATWRQQIQQSVQEEHAAQEAERVAQAVWRAKQEQQLKLLAEQMVALKSEFRHHYTCWSRPRTSSPPLDDSQQ